LTCEIGSTGVTAEFPSPNPEQFDALRMKIMQIAHRTDFLNIDISSLHNEIFPISNLSIQNYEQPKPALKIINELSFRCGNALSWDLTFYEIAHLSTLL
jgi:hypothetical protein